MKNLEELKKSEIEKICKDCAVNFKGIDLICYGQKIKIRYINKHHHVPFAIYVNGKNFGSCELFSLSDILINDIMEECKFNKNVFS